MAQSFQALKCYHCHIFQVQIKKKSKRWACKVCGEKQSLMKIYGEGSSKDCRIHVQRLNSLRGTQEEAKRAKYEDVDEEEGVLTASSSDQMGEDESGRGTSKQRSRWADYLENDVENADSDSEEEAEPPETPHSNANATPKSKWEHYVNESSPSTVHALVKHEDEQKNSSNSRHKVKKQRSPVHNELVDGAVNYNEDAFREKSTPQSESISSNDTQEPCYKKICSETSSHIAARNYFDAGAGKAEGLAQSSLSSDQRKPDLEHANAFSSTEFGELDEILKFH